VKIYGTNFHGATLTGANFYKAKCGIKIWWNISILIGSLFIMSWSGFSASIIINCNYYYFLGRYGIIETISSVLISISYIAIFQGYFLNKYLHFDISYLIYIGIVIILTVGIFIPFIQVMDDSREKDAQIFVIIGAFSLVVVLMNIIILLLIQIETSYCIPKTREFHQHLPISWLKCEQLNNFIII